MAAPVDDDIALADRYDGAFRCRLCPDEHPHEDNDWCPVLQGVACEDCCRSLMLGDERMLGAVAYRLGHGVTPKDVIGRCTECSRLIRLVSEHVLADEGEAARLPMH